MRTDRKHYVISAETDLPFAEAVNRVEICSRKLAMGCSAR